MRVLVLNSGSSSIKWELFDMPAETSIHAGLAERIADSAVAYRHAFDTVLDAAAASGDLTAIGHRVVHGGSRFRDPLLLDSESLSALRGLIPLAPLHMGPNIEGVEAALSRFPDVPQVAAFDTGFHHSLPEHAYRYALPREMVREFGVRRFGFHGISHAHMVREASAWLARPEQALNLITLHLGNGASVAAIRAGRSVDTSMGMTPLEGLVMGTRSGDIDPAIPLYLQHVTGRDAHDVEGLLNHESGLKGLCGESDMRDVHRLADAGDADASLALDIFCYRAKKYVGAYFAVLGHVDALVFSGGIGEHDADVRARVTSGMEAQGIQLDESRNRAPSTSVREVHQDGGAVSLLVVPAEEALEIARYTVRCLQAARSR